jgi:hypothetical protein
MSGTWDGDPARHTVHAMTVVNDFSEQVALNGHPERSFIMAFARFPKVLHEMLLAATTLVVNGANPVTFAEIERIQIWFSTVFALVGVATILALVWRALGARAAVITLAIVAWSTYILLYANFPRHNMPGHAFSWGAIALYLLFRTRHDSASEPPGSANSHLFHALAIGLLFGVAVPVHYTSVYAFIAILAVEGFYFLRSGLKLQYILFPTAIFGAATLGWFSIDLYYYLMAFRFPELRSPLLPQPYLTGGFSFLEGMAYTFQRISNQLMADKLVTQVWWFLPGFLWRNFGIVGTAFFAIGLLAGLIRPLWSVTPMSPIRGRFVTAAIVMTLVSAYVSLGFFQSARKLVIFLPAWAILIGLGVEVVTTAIGAALTRLGAKWPTLGPSPNTAALIAAVAILAVHGLTQASPALAVMESRHAPGLMRAELASRGITSVMEHSAVADTNMAPNQVDINDLTLDEARKWKYLVTNHRMYIFTNPKGIALRECMAQVKPLASFPNQASTPMFWYEFPVRLDRFDTMDPVVSRRNLYLWADLEKTCGPQMRDAQAFVWRKGKEKK